MLVYLNPQTTKSVKETIADNPKDALCLINELDVKMTKIPNEKNKQRTAEDKMLSALRLLFKVISEVELILTIYELYYG